MRQERKKGESPTRGRHLRGALGRMDSSPPLAAPFLGGRGKGCTFPSPLALYIVGKRRGKPTLLPGPPPPSCNTPSSSRSCLAKPCRSSAASTTTPSCLIFLNL